MKRRELIDKRLVALNRRFNLPLDERERGSVTLIQWSPGDGWTRYQVGQTMESRGFLPLSGVLGWKELISYFDGLESGAELATQTWKESR